MRHEQFESPGVVETRNFHAHRPETETLVGYSCEKNDQSEAMTVMLHCHEMVI